MKARLTGTRAACAAAAALTLATGLAVAAPNAANAVILEEVDRPKITESGYDFGTNWDTVGAPLNGGYVYWDLTDGVTTPIIEGNLYLKNVSGNCAKLKVEYLDEDSRVMETDYSPERCASRDKKYQWWETVDDYGAVGLTYVRIKIISTPNGGDTWYLQGETTWAVH